MLFERDGFMNSSTAFVYDESDEIALPDSARSDAWKKRASDLERCGFEVKPMGGHFYYVLIMC